MRLATHVQIEKIYTSYVAPFDLLWPTVEPGDSSMGKFTFSLGQGPSRKSAPRSIHCADPQRLPLEPATGLPV